MKTSLILCLAALCGGFASPAQAAGGPSAFEQALQDGADDVVDRSGAAVSVAEFSQRANSVSFRVSVSAATTIELRELAYPGWQVSIDGETRPSEVSDSIYRRVEVPAGSHRIEWTYRPRSLQLGAVLSGLILAGWGWVWWRTRVTAPLPPPPNSSR